MEWCWDGATGRVKEKKNRDLCRVSQQVLACIFFGVKSLLCVLLWRGYLVENRDFPLHGKGGDPYPKNVIPIVDFHRNRRSVFEFFWKIRQGKAMGLLQNAATEAYIHLRIRGEPLPF